MNPESLTPQDVQAYNGSEGKLTLERCYYYCVTQKRLWMLVSKGPAALRVSDAMKEGSCRRVGQILSSAVFFCVWCRYRLRCLWLDLRRVFLELAHVHGTLQTMQ